MACALLALLRRPNVIFDGRMVLLVGFSIRYQFGTKYKTTKKKKEEEESFVETSVSQSGRLAVFGCCC